MKAELKPEELRVGNYFQLLSSRPVRIPESTIFKIVEIHAFSFSCVRAKEIPAQVEEWQTFPFNKLSPIELSEEWLKKAGFDVIDDGGYYNTFSLNLLFEISSDGDGFWSYHHYQGPTKLKYVHQLQNLFYALTGNELIFNHG